MSCVGFKFLEHTADVYFVSSGLTIEEAFENAAKAMFEVITDTSKVEPRECVDVSDECSDMLNCLYRWLEDLLILHDTRNMVFSKFKFKFIELGSDLIKFSGTACGEVFNHEKHEPRVVVKAVTYSLMRVENIGSCWYAYVVLDI